MVKSPTNGTNNNDWKEVVYDRCYRSIATMPSKFVQLKGGRGKKSEGFKSIAVKQEEMTAAMMARSSPPKSKRNPTSKIIVLSDESETKMDIDKVNENEKTEFSEDSSEEDSVLKKLPKPKKKKGHGFVNFMAALDSDDEDEDMLSEPNDQDADKEVKAHRDTEIVELDVNSKNSEDYNGKDSEQDESEDKFWTEEEMKLATALWNDANPKEIYQLKGRWFHMYSGRSSPLRDPCKEFIADAVEVNKGQKGANLINPWPKKTKSKEPHLLQLQKEKADKLEQNKQAERADTIPSCWKEQIKKSIMSGSTLKQAANKGYRSPPKKMLAKTAFSANQQWLDKAEMVVKASSPPLKGIEPSLNNQTKPKITSDTKITAHFKTSKVTPTSTKSEGKKEVNPYKTSPKTQEIQKTGSAVAKAIQDEKSEGQNQEQTTVDQIFPPKHAVSFADAMKGNTFERILQKYPLM